MKVAVFTDNFFPETNGLVTALLNHFRTLGKKGYEFVVFCPQHDARIHLSNVRQVSFPSVQIPSYTDSRVGFPGRKKVMEVIAEEKPDVIHVHTPFLIGREGIKAGTKMGIPVVGTYHTKLDNFVKYVSLLEMMGLGKHIRLPHGIKKKASWIYSNAFYRSCDLITTPTKTMKDALAKNGMKNEICVLSNGVDLGIFKPKKDYRSKMKLLHAGRISYEKRIDVLLRAMTLIRKDATMTIAGSGPDLARLKRIRDGLGLKGRVKFIGSVDHDKLGRLHHSHDIFLTASDMETQGLAALEAVASGMPIICVNRMAVQELVDKNGFVVPHKDYRAFAWNVNSIIKDDKTLERMGRRSREIAQEHDLVAVAEKLDCIYNRLCGKNQAK